MQWLAPSRIRTRRPGDTLVVLLASALLILLGVAALAVRFGSSPSEATANTLATLPTAVMRAPAPAAANAPRPEAQEKIAARNEPPPQDAIVATPIAPVSLAKLDPPITGSTAISAVAPATARVKVDAAAFAPVAIPSVPAVRRDEAETASAPALTPRIEPARAPEPAAAPVREARATPDTTAEDAPTAPVRTARTTPDASAAAPAQRKGGAGATWAVYFDHFPDMKSAAAKINGLQGKYGPYLAGRKLTYGRSGAGGYRVRVTGLTEDAAQAMCGKVKGAGSLCAVGGK